jgi:hypothetical protein
MTHAASFPTVHARDLQGREVTIPGAFEGRVNVVLVAFRRDHQRLVDSWVPWLEAQAEAQPDFRFYEIPTIGRLWAPFRNVIDGGMAAAIKVPHILARTLTVYGDVSRITTPLSIDDRSTIALFVVDGNGTVLWSGKGGFTAGAAAQLETVLR